MYSVYQKGKGWYHIIVQFDSRDVVGMCISVSGYSRDVVGM